MASMSWGARAVAWTVLVALLMAIAYGSRLSEGKPPANALYQYETAVGGIAIYLILLAVVLWIGRGLPRRDFLALRRPASWRRALGLALGGYVTIFVGAGLLILLLDAGDEQGLTPDEWDSSRLGPYAANFVAIAVVGPIVEELTYRGAGMTLFLRFGAPVAVAVTAVGFGLGHGLIVALPALVFFGLVTAFLRLRTDSVYPSALVHCAFNATSLILAVTT
jgi:membrane protease YdiL (CAAX protease family)